MKKIHVVIPVVQTEMADVLLNILVKNTVLPKKIIIIDNSLKNYLPPKNVTSNIDTEVYQYNPPKLVNEAWRIGFGHSKDADIVSVLNDDILVSKYFFEKILITFDRLEDVAIVSPYTKVPDGIRGVRCRSGSIHFPETSSPISNKVMPIMFRQGWAYSIRRDVLDRIPPIPNRLSMFCGDDWLFLWATNMGLKWYLMLDNKCFHYTGTSISKMAFRKRIMLKEKRLLTSILKTHPDFNQEHMKHIGGVRQSVQPITSL